MKSKTLAQLYAEHEGKVSDKWSLYLAEYDRIFNEYRFKPIRMLEVGIQNGGSLDIWSKYFSNGEKFIGCDINSDCSLLQYDDPRITFVIGDANSDKTRDTILQRSPEFDIVIDDGSHMSSDIVKTFAKYFPTITDGGVFVAEDLHCSYWEGFEGGLFDPFSSITFFKFLADVINHEHWGVEKRRTDLLRGFFSKYGFKLDEGLLEQVHSIEFINSICVARKSSPQSNLLGYRFIAGNIEKVVSGHAEIMESPLKSPSQTHNCYSSSDLSPYEELPLRLKELADRNGQIEQLNHSVDELLSSKSWRLTAPLRAIGEQFRRIRALRCLILQAVRRDGGVFRTALKVLNVLRREGVMGVKQRLRLGVYSANQPGIIVDGQSVDRNDYTEWIRRYDTLTDEARSKMCERIEAFTHKPLISVVMPTITPIRNGWLRRSSRCVSRFTQIGSYVLLMMHPAILPSGNYL